LEALRAAALCTDGETVLIDGGSTTFQMAEFLRSARLQIITNSFAIAQSLAGHSGNTIILSGGILYPDSQLVLDPFQDEAFRNYYAAKVFMGVYGIDELGATNTDHLLIKTERAMIEHARELVVLADSSKWGRRGSLLLCGLEKIHTLITDGGVTEEQRELASSRGVRLLVV
jgi:DeoR family ulaG and ulaABCDEF operon transcriptional repressor